MLGFSGDHHYFEDLQYSAFHDHVHISMSQYGEIMCDSLAMILIIRDNMVIILTILKVF